MAEELRSSTAERAAAASLVGAGSPGGDSRLLPRGLASPVACTAGLVGV